MLSYFSSSVVYMQEVLEHICRKRKLDNPKEWALLSKDFKTLILLDRTIASLEGSSELALVRRSSLPSYGFPLDGDRRAGRSTDPNGRQTFVIYIMQRIPYSFFCSVNFQTDIRSPTKEQDYRPGLQCI